MPDSTTTSTALTPATPLALPLNLNALQGTQVSSGSQIAPLNTSGLDPDFLSALQKKLDLISGSQNTNVLAKLDLQGIFQEQRDAAMRLSAILNVERNPANTYSSGAGVGSIGSDPWTMAEQDMLLHLQKLQSPTSPGPMQQFSGTGSSLDAVQALLSGARQQNPATPRIALAP